MDIRFLESYLKIVELGSIAAAARYLDLTPASLAQRIGVLEKDIGAKVITRSGRTVKPTVAGIRILKRAHQLVRDVRDLKSLASTDDLPAGPLRLGATPTALTGLLPNALRIWGERFPNVEIYIEPDTSGSLHNKVLSGHLDAAVLVHPMFELSKSCKWVELRKEPMVLLTGLHIESKRSFFDILKDEPYIRYDRSVVGGRLVDQYLHQKKIRPNVRFELDGIEAIAKLVAEGLGVAILPDWPITGEMSMKTRKHAIPEPIPSRRVGLLFHRASVRTQLAEELLTILMDEVKVVYRDRTAPSKRA